MKIAFLALTGTVAFSQIGGTDSFMRRLIYGLLKRDPSLDISCVFYSSEACAQARPTARLSFLYFTSFEEAGTIAGLVELGLDVARHPHGFHVLGPALIS